MAHAFSAATSGAPWRSRPKACSTHSGLVSTPNGSCCGSIPKEARPPSGSRRWTACGIGFVDPAEREIVVVQPSIPNPVAYLNHAGRPLANGTTVSVATGMILELAVPFNRLEVGPGEPIRFYVELLGGESSLDRAPREGIFELVVPCPDFERILWQV